MKRIRTGVIPMLARKCIRVCFLSLAMVGFALSLQPGVATAVPIVDPTGDTFNTGTIDITSTNAALSGSNIVFTVTFAGNISAASAFAANSVVGFIDIDTDRNSATGGTAPWGVAVIGGNSWINFFIPPNPGTPSIPGPTANLGDEFYIDLGSELFHPGLVDVVTTSTNLPVGTVAIAYGASSLSLSVPLSLLGGDDGVLNYGLIVGDLNAPTDRAANGATPLTSAAIPEPFTLALLGLGLFGIGFSRRKKT